MTKPEQQFDGMDPIGPDDDFEIGQEVVYEESESTEPDAGSVAESIQDVKP